MNLGFVLYNYYNLQPYIGKNSFFKFEIRKSRIIVIFREYTLKRNKMARKQLEKYLNQLDIKKGEFLEKQRKEYKFARFQRSLEILDKASNFNTIPTEILSKIELIFNLMPSHELYYIKKDEVQFLEYLKEVNQLFIRVLDEYEQYNIEINNFLKKLFNVLFPIIFLLILYHEKFEKWIGLEFTILSSIIIAIGLILTKRRELWNSYFKLE